ILQEQATANIYAQAGLQEGDRVYSNARESLSLRIPWMLINLGLAAIASSVVSLFEDTMSQLIVLASLKNIVAGIGGNTAIQTLTVVTRGMATGDFSFTSHWKAIAKETMVGLSLGVIIGGLAGVLTYFWKGDLLVSIILFVAMMLNSIVASFFGATVPLILKKWKWDPAVASGPLVTMATDIFGFLSFLGLAALVLKFMGH
ncbi:MAG TPA: magnesium transporter, partial [Bdellovibrionales bacterium]|nr:magnesium transporter [Bdellovibrionales bacterium]